MMLTVPSIDAPPSRSKLVLFPSFTAASAQAAQKALEDNHQRFHVFFNDSGFHNHFVHHALSALALGLPPKGIDAIYDKDKRDTLDEAWEYNRRPKQLLSPTHTDQKSKDSIQHGGTAVEVDESNWTSFAGNRAQYWPYLAFIHTYINQHGIAAALEKFVFSKEANAPGVEMLARFIGGLIHPLIHAGYGAEFALNGIVAEGLTMAIITDDHWKVLLPRHDDLSSKVGAVARLAGLDLFSSSSNDQRLDIFSICELIAQDEDLMAKVTGPSGREGIPSALEHAVPLAFERGYFDLWKLTSADLRDPTAQEPGWMAKWEELVWFCSVLSMGATVKPGQKMTHDFFLVHLNNAALFMPVLLPLLSERSRSDLLQVYFRICMTVWLGLGRPSFHVGATLMASTDCPRNPHAQSATAVDYGKEAISHEPPAWYELAAAASVHGDAHHVKAIRALMFYDQHFAHRPAGFARVQTELVKAQMEKRDALKGKQIHSVFEGLDKLDGTAFLRTAGQLMQSQGWKTDSLELNWSFAGFFSQTPSSQL